MLLAMRERLGLPDLAADAEPTPQQRRLARSGLTEADLIDFSRPSHEDSEDEPVMSESDAALEVSRICLSNNSRRTQFDLQRLAGTSIDREPVKLAARQYDDSSELRLTPSQRDIDIDQYVARLSRQGRAGERAFGLARGQGGPDLEQQLDANPPSESDLSGGLDLYDQSPDSPTSFSPRATEELNAMPDAAKANLASALDAADAADDAPTRTYHLMRAAHLAHGKHLKGERSISGSRRSPGRRPPACRRHRRRMISPLAG